MDALCVFEGDFFKADVGPEELLELFRGDFAEAFEAGNFGGLAELFGAFVALLFGVAVIRRFLVADAEERRF